MGVIKHRLTHLFMAIALLGSIAATAAPATHAAMSSYLVSPYLVSPYLTITALHGSTFVYGYNFSNGQSVILRAYGITSAGQKVLLAATAVTSIAPVPYSLDFQWDFAQAQDPCNGSGGYLNLEVDAYNNSMLVIYRYFITRATATVQCGNIIY